MILPLPSASNAVEHLLFEDVITTYIFQKGATLFNRST